ncbi:hypothetical protein SKAU_G00110130 [Synaphobranchus kaupii]|uniref:Uncharacterized protein n=1 Tax=Synaphobranchus kaupii TaxID=118154 RepID=A0A9Q1G088_SYNKA|nr:hypothetical protein SKAU_G00110130 [Synaphobranchus kaupii]
MKKTVDCIMAVRQIHKSLISYSRLCEVLTGGISAVMWPGSERLVRWYTPPTERELQTSRFLCAVSLRPLQGSKRQASVVAPG